MDDYAPYPHLVTSASPDYSRNASRQDYNPDKCRRRDHHLGKTCKYIEFNHICNVNSMFLITILIKHYNYIVYNMIKNTGYLPSTLLLLPSTCSFTKEFSFQFNLLAPYMRAFKFVCSQMIYCNLHQFFDLVE